MRVPGKSWSGHALATIMMTVDDLAPRAHPPPDWRAFSLVELIVVFGVMLLVMGAGVTIFKTVAGSGADSGARSVARELRLARQLAITKRAYVAVLLPRCTDNTLPAKYRATAFRSCYVVRNGANWNFDTINGFIPNTQWEYLPPRVYLSDFAAQTVNTVATPPGSSGATANLRGVVFSPRGGLVTTTSLTDVTVGVGDSCSDATLAQPFVLSVNWMTGRVTFTH